MNKLKQLKLVIVAVILTIATVALAVIADSSPIRLVDFSVRSKSELGVNTYYQTFTWEFSRPLSENMLQKLDDVFKFSPQIEGNFKLNGNRVTFSPSKPLNYDQEYKITITTELEDIYRKKLLEDYELEFKTKPLQFLAQRQNPAGGADLLLVKYFAPASHSEQVIASSKKLREYASDYSGDRIIYTVQEYDQGPTKAYLYSQERGAVSELDLGARFAISSLQFDRFGNLVFLGAIPDVDLNRIPVEELPEVYVKPYRYSFSENKLIELSALEKQYGDILDLQVAPDGNTAIVHRYNYDMEVVSLLDGSAVTLGKYNNFGEFNYNGNMVGVLNVDYEKVDFVPQVQIYTDSKITSTTAERGYAKDPYIGTSGKIISYASRIEQIEGIEGRFATRLAKINSEDIGADISLEVEEKSLELGMLSPDEKLLVVEEYDVDDLVNVNQVDVRRYVNAGKPLGANIRLYIVDMEKGKPGRYDYSKLENAFNVVWVF